ncbi:MAG: NAD(P)(+) transhydrogenase (Re/Si-specific) subunit beta [SAR324 cluster bacterium]|nr:NAD(P)(+) transhydrogenase (Re/Si-specific) subunit beta [SAR324 cluster bacterium]MBF0352538.1 NAD(P)(+) transhydrogenase (Re/Si-specific) subunit beta [SAR324 cluster bacterium]
MMALIINIAYLVSAVLFITGLKGLSSPKTAPLGNKQGAVGMLIAVLATLLDRNVLSYGWIILGIIIGSGIGVWLAKKVQMTQMPQMVALLNGLGGGASLLVAAAAYLEEVSMVAAGSAEPGIDWSVALVLSGLIGAVTLSGSLVAYAKLEGHMENAFKIPNEKNVRFGSVGLLALFSLVILFDPANSGFSLLMVFVISLGLGVLLVMGIGGADMPVVIALLNSYSGLAAAATGFILNNNGLIISGSLVGASGLILSSIMCKAMNRSLVNVLFGGAIVSDDAKAALPGKEFYEGKVKSTGPDEVAMLLDGAQKVVFVPGYGLAVAQAQHVTRELADMLIKKGIDVKYAIHPVAGRMPGHMNVLLAEAEVPYEQLVEMDAINPEFAQTDVAIILGANDVTNPAARDDKSSPIFGMPILEVDKSRTVVVVKRSLSPGFAGIPNQLFINENSLMMFSDAKEALQGIINSMKEL